MCFFNFHTFDFTAPYRGEVKGLSKGHFMKWHYMLMATMIEGKTVFPVPKMVSFHTLTLSEGFQKQRPTYVALP